ncbi:hypothetical protein TanjilG_08697 [Lupinus angustifolius]|uniref:starch synthase n=1 Tax=Lupinus angustifolius TaxID=3871 RepID=A0A4P1QX29_LUPAN|nr:hypothetical protein TanjilG_08697 [Lupinus angustifolius]
MESLELSRVLLLTSSSSLLTTKAIRQLGFRCLLKKPNKNGNLRLTRSFSGHTGGGPAPSASQAEDEHEDDDFGSIVAFNLVPESGKITEEDATSNGVEVPEAGDVEEEKVQNRVSYNIVFVTAEAAPYSKTGGLGDVCGSLPIALAARGHRVMVVSPMYINSTPGDEKFSGAVDLNRRIQLYCFGSVQEVGFFHEFREGVDWVFVDHPSFRRPGNPYGDKFGTFGDNQFRFTLLSYAACEAPLVLPLGGFTYGDKCLFLVNDWHASLVPTLLAAKYRPHGVYKDARSILVIHNIAHQGVEPAITYGNLGLPPEWYGSLEWVFPNWARMHALDKGEAVNFLKGAIVTSDRILTVSKGYSWEITTREGGYGLHELLSSRKSVLSALAARGHRVMVVSPMYINSTPGDEKFSGAVDLNRRIQLYCFGSVQEVGFFHEFREGVDWVFVDHPSFRRPGNPYGDKFGTFGDNQFRFTLLSYAACEAPLVLPLGGFTYGDKCLFLVNDWHASLVPTLLAAKYRPHGVYKDARSILVIHNIAHQGVEPAITYGNLGLPPEWYGSLEWVFPNWARMHALDKGEAVNFLKGAIVTSDRILTVSKGYSWEITTREGGYGLHELLSSRKSVLSGITNGIDETEWDPSIDQHIAFNYSIDDLSGKVKCKISLQEELGLAVRPECPVIGFIGRLDYQKGIDLIRMAIPEIMENDVQFVMLGSGNPAYEDWMRATESAYRDKFRGWVGFNVPISHKITAGCDILLMPSAFEPCGLNQLYAMRYGTIPVVHETGGLRDTVQSFNPYGEGTNGEGVGTGWTFSPLTKESMLVALRHAIKTYKEHKSSWNGLMKRGMTRDYTWVNAATQYEQVIEWAFMDPPYCC